MISTINLGALAAQFSLENKDEFKDVYVILRDVAYKMTSSIKKYVYAMNAFGTGL